MTEIALREAGAEVARVQDDPTGGRLVAWAQAAHAAHELAGALSRTSFSPKAFQGNPGDATAAIILGDELGLSPLTALRSIYVISGTPALYARTMVALAMSHGHNIWTEESTDTRVTVCGQRKGSGHVEKVTWTLERARKAGYTNNRKYDTDPQGMLYARASAEVARKIAADVLSGVPYSVEEIELEQVETTTVQRETAPKTVQRKPKPAPEPDAEPGFDETEAAPAPEQSTVSITQSQLKMLHALMNEAGITERDERLSFVLSVVGREVASSNDLSKTEASQVIDALKDRVPADEPGALL